MSPNQIESLGIGLVHPTGPAPDPQKIAQVLAASAQLMRVCEAASLRGQFLWMRPALERLELLKP